MGKFSSAHPAYEGIQINETPFPYSSDLSYFDAQYGALSNSKRRVIWTVWFAAGTISAGFNAFIFTSILRNREIRKKPYNLFLLFLMIPDMVYSGCGAIQNLTNVITREYGSVGACRFQNFYILFGFMGNVYVNMLIALELHRLLKTFHKRQRYIPPTVLTVAARCLGSWFLVATIIACGVMIFPGPVVFKPALIGGGTYCHADPWDQRSALFFFLFAKAIGLGVPFFTTIWVCVDVWWKGYLPKQAVPTRVLALFFLRLLVVFLVFWLPAIVLFVPRNPWARFAGITWSYIQGVASATAMLSKEDVWDCVKEFSLSLNMTKCVGSGFESPKQESSVYIDDNLDERAVPDNPYLADDPENFDIGATSIFEYEASDCNLRPKQFSSIQEGPSYSSSAGNEMGEEGNGTGNLLQDDEIHDHCSAVTSTSSSSKPDESSTTSGPKNDEIQTPRVHFLSPGALIAPRARRENRLTSDLTEEMNYSVFEFEDVVEDQVVDSTGRGPAHAPLYDDDDTSVSLHNQDMDSSASIKKNNANLQNRGFDGSPIHSGSRRILRDVPAAPVPFRAAPTVSVLATQNASRELYDDDTCTTKGDNSANN